jgi:hypothetical protein
MFTPIKPQHESYRRSVATDTIPVGLGMSEPKRL